MTTKNNLPFNIGLFTKNSDGKSATCRECKESGKNAEFLLAGSTTKSLVTHLFSKAHKEYDYAKRYNELLENLETKKQKDQPTIDGLFAATTPTGEFCSLFFQIIKST